MKLPLYANLAKNYPGETYSTQQVRQLIGGAANNPKFENTCVLRVSRAFNYAGTQAKIPGGKAGLYTVMGADKLSYALRVAEFKQYMINTYGSPSKVSLLKDKKIDKTKFMGINGVICFEVSGWGDATGHFSLWDGNNCSYCGDHEYFNMVEGVRTTKISLWEC
jgi:Type VI secretion system (T6SS), amidase effector protein 4